MYQFKQEHEMARPFIQRYETSSGAARYRAWYYDAIGTKVGKVFHTKREAESFLKTKAAEEATGTLADSVAGRVTFESVWNERLAREDFAPATVKAHENVWRIAGPILGRRAVGDIRETDVEAVLAGFPGAGAKAKTRSILVAVFNYAISQRRRATNPARATRRSRTRAAKIATKASADDNQRYLTDAQLAALVAAMPERYRALVKLMARVGLRPGEAYALTVDQFDEDRRTLRIDRTVDGPTTKTGEARTITLPAVVADMLVAHVTKFAVDGLVFPNRDGRMLDRNSFRHVFQRASVRGDVNHGLSPNHLRHTAAAFAIAHGANVYDVQRMLGHAKPSITLDVYGHLWEGSSERIADALDAAIRAAEGNAS